MTAKSSNQGFCHGCMCYLDTRSARNLGLDGDSIKCKSCDALIFFVIFIKWNSLVDGWMDDMCLYVIFNSISVISGRWAGENKRLCAMELRLRLKNFPHQAGLEPGTARSVGQRLTH